MPEIEANMNQQEATQQVALTLVSGGIFDNVRIVTPTDQDVIAVILTELFDQPLAVTVQALAQP